MQITANHVVLRNDVSIDVIANDHFCNTVLFFRRLWAMTVKFGWACLRSFANIPRTATGLFRTNRQIVLMVRRCKMSDATFHKAVFVACKLNKQCTVTGDAFNTLSYL